MYTILLIMSMMITASSALILALNPLSMGIIILLMALLLTMSYASLLTSWIAFLIFLIYISGMLVMFAYFVAITPNQHMNIKMLAPVMLTLSSMMIMSSMLSYPPMTLHYMKYMNLMYNMSNAPTLIMLALILLFTMVVVVKLVTNNKGPLRPFINYV